MFAWEDNYYACHLLSGACSQASLSRELLLNVDTWYICATIRSSKQLRTNLVNLKLFSLHFTLWPSRDPLLDDVFTWLYVPSRRERLPFMICHIGQASLGQDPWSTECRAAASLHIFVPINLGSTTFHLNHWKKKSIPVQQCLKTLTKSHSPSCRAPPEALLMNLSSWAHWHL